MALEKFQYLGTECHEWPREHIQRPPELALPWQEEGLVGPALLPISPYAQLATGILLGLSLGTEGGRLVVVQVASSAPAYSAGCPYCPAPAPCKQQVDSKLPGVGKPLRPEISKRDSDQKKTQWGEVLRNERDGKSLPSRHWAG